MSLEVVFGGLIQEVKAAFREVLREELGRLPPTTSPTPELALTVSQAAQRLGGVHPSTVRGWIKSGVLTASKTPGGREYLVRPADIEEFLRTQHAQPTPPKQDDEDARIARIVDSVSRRK